MDHEYILGYTFEHKTSGFTKKYVEPRFKFIFMSSDTPAQRY